MIKYEDLTYYQSITVGFSRLLNALFGGSANQMLSSRAHEQDWWLELVIDALFFWEEEPHCKTSYEWEQGISSELHKPNEACKEIQYYAFCFWICLLMAALISAGVWLLFVIINY